jgi:UDP-N-acetylglucosamine transferase subunit ALG13
MNILIFPLPELGHIRPTIPLCQHLVAQGHNVYYLTAPQYEHVISPAGGITIGLCEQRTGEQLSGGSIWYRYVLNSGRDLNLDMLMMRLKQTLLSKRFSLFICDYILDSRIYKEILTIMTSRRIILISTSLLDWNRLKRRVESDIIVLCPRSFEIPKFSDKGRNLHYCEPSLFLDNGTITRPQSCARLTAQFVLASFGSQSIRYRQLPTVLRAINDTALQHPEIAFAVMVGQSCGLQRYKDILRANNIELCSDLCQQSLLKNADAFISHGGLGSIKEAILHKVPIVVTPMLFDQPFNALRVDYHRLGTALFPENCNGKTLGTVLQEALGGKFEGNLAHLHGIFMEAERHRPSWALLDERCASLFNA